MTRGPGSARGWSPLPQGPVTGIDWSAPGAIEGIDPYLPWAEADRFQGYRLGGCRHSLPRWLPIIIELQPGCEVQDLLAATDTRWLQVPRAYLLQPGLRYCTARVNRHFFKAMRERRDLASVIRRYELGLPVEEHTRPLADPARAGERPVPDQPPLDGRVLGIIDGGLALAHADFLRPDGLPRVRYFWRQDEFDGPHGGCAGRRLQQPLDPARSGPRPPVMSYGHELTAQRIHQAMQAYTRHGMVDEDNLYDHLQFWDLKHLMHHGTHVASLAAGQHRGTARMSDGTHWPDMTGARDAASLADIVAVQLDWSNVVDTSGGAMNVSVLDALIYILARTTPDARVVVNISWGTLAGPHDGSSVLEAAIDQLVELRGPEHLQVVVPAGNGVQGRTHLNRTLEAGETVTLSWCVQPDDRTQSFLELWAGYPDLPGEAVQDLFIQVEPPGRQPLPPLAIGHAGCWPSGDAPLAALIFPRRTALGRHGTCALLALCPTASLDPEDRLAPAGLWRVTLVNKGFHPVVLDAYVERDDVALGTSTGARQSYMTDTFYDTSGNIDSFIDNPDDPTPIRRSGVFNSIGTGMRTVPVGGIRFAGSTFDPAARYSPRLPDPDASRLPQRAQVRKVPVRLAVSDESTALWGVMAASSRSGGSVRLSGTSCAAPQVTRDLLDRQP